jgi:hypothetical protein
MIIIFHEFEIFSKPYPSPLLPNSPTISLQEVRDLLREMREVREFLKSDITSPTDSTCVRIDPYNPEAEWQIDNPLPPQLLLFITPCRPFSPSFQVEMTHQAVTRRELAGRLFTGRSHIGRESAVNCAGLLQSPLQHQRHHLEACCKCRGIDSVVDSLKLCTEV